jgi:hypothetical protein
VVTVSRYKCCRFLLMFHFYSPFGILQRSLHLTIKTSVDRAIRLSSLYLCDLLLVNSCNISIFFRTMGVIKWFSVPYYSSLR